MFQVNWMLDYSAYCLGEGMPRLTEDCHIGQISRYMLPTLPKIPRKRPKWENQQEQIKGDIFWLRPIYTQYINLHSKAVSSISFSFYNLAKT